MNTIYPHSTDDYYDAKPLNLVRTSDNQGFAKAVAELMPQLGLTGTPKEKTCLKAILVNLSRIAYAMPTTPISFSRDDHFWADMNRPKARALNPLGLSRKTLDVIDAMAKHGWIAYRKGYYNRGLNQADKSFSMRSRMRLLPKVTDLLKRHGLVGAETRLAMRTFPVIRLKDVNLNPVYRLTMPKEVKHSETFIKRYNAFIAGQGLDLAMTNPAYFLDEREVYRSFNRSSFSKGGRFAGGWWMSCKREDRKRILINGEKTVELDYKGQHINLLYAQRGIALPKLDAYTLPNLKREYVKEVCLTLVNSDSPKAAWLACRREALKPNGSLALRAELEDTLSSYDDFEAMVLEPILTLHAPIREDFCVDKGIGLQNVDSNIAQSVLEAMTIQGIPCLSVHDSFIVGASHEASLRVAMEQAYVSMGLAGFIPEIKFS